MITAGEAERLAAEWGLTPGRVERDYVAGWLMAAIGADPRLAETWVVRGSLALRKCYRETYRFAGELEVAVRPGGPLTPGQLAPTLRRLAAWLKEQAGIDIAADAGLARRNGVTGGLIAYRRAREWHERDPEPVLGLVLRADKALAEAPVWRTVHHPYDDGPLPGPGVACRPLGVLLTETLQALGERWAPDTLYDVLHLYCHSGIARPTREAPGPSAVPEWPPSGLEKAWESTLRPELPAPPPALPDAWAALDEALGWLQGRILSIPSPRMDRPDLDATWSPPPAPAAWDLDVPLELVRYAGANRLRIDVDYRAENGRAGRRRVEPYALRRTRAGDLILMVVNDRDQVRGYRVDRIAAVAPTTDTFRPRYQIEL